MKGVVIVLVCLLIVGAVAVAFFYNSASTHQSLTDNKNVQPIQENIPQPETANPEPSPTPAQTSSTVNIDISGFAFNPSLITIKAGDTIVWTNMDSAPHTVTSTSGKELESKTLDKGDTYSHTFTQAGTYDYFCAIHHGMRAKVIVE